MKNDVVAVEWWWDHDYMM